MWRLGGGCALPLGAHATIDAESIRLVAVIATADGTTVMRAETDGATAEDAAEAVAKDLISQARSASWPRSGRGERALRTDRRRDAAGGPVGDARRRAAQTRGADDRRARDRGGAYAQRGAHPGAARSGSRGFAWIVLTAVRPCRCSCRVPSARALGATRVAAIGREPRRRSAGGPGERPPSCRPPSRPRGSYGRFLAAPGGCSVREPTSPLPGWRRPGREGLVPDPGRRLPNEDAEVPAPGSEEGAGRRRRRRHPFTSASTVRGFVGRSAPCAERRRSSASAPSRPRRRAPTGSRCTPSPDPRSTAWSRPWNARCAARRPGRRSLDRGERWRRERRRRYADSMSFPEHRPGGCGARPPSSPRARPALPRRPDHAVVLQGSIEEALPIASMPGQFQHALDRSARRPSRSPGPGSRIHALRGARSQGRRGIRGMEPRRHRPARDRRASWRVRRRRGRDERSLP